MKNLFSFDSSFMQTLSRITNLIFLNLLWLICSLPMITIGPTTTAMYYVIFQYLTNQTDSVIRPFFHSLRDNFRQSLVLWIPLFLLDLLLVVDALYLFANYSGVFHPLWLVFILMMVVCFSLSTYVFPLLARYNTRNIDAIRNSVVLFLIHPIQSVIIILLQTLPWIVLLCARELFARAGILWFMLGFSLPAYWSGKLYIRVFEKNTKENESIET